jgi:hypothetical protein
MDKYTVELASPAASMYQNLVRLAAGDKNSDTRMALSHSLDKIIEETLPSSPFNSGIQLSAQLKGLYWIGLDPIHIFYEIPSFKFQTVSIVSILMGLPSAEEKADAIVTAMMLSGRLQVLPQDGRSLRAAAN